MAVRIEFGGIWSDVAKPEPVKEALRAAVNPESTFRERDDAVSKLRAVVSFYSKEGPKYRRFVNHVKDVKDKAMEMRNER